MVLKDELELMRLRWAGCKGTPGGQRGPPEERGRGRNSEWAWENINGSGCVRSAVIGRGLRDCKVPGCIRRGPTLPAQAQEAYSYPGRF